jgi:hypothetical protein
MARPLLCLAWIAICGCASHTAKECPPSFATVQGGTSGLDDGDGGALAKECQKLCGHADCSILNATQLLCETGCP